MQSRTHRTVKRPRQSLSCVACRRRKVRCGREQPVCNNCVRLSLECHYETFPGKETSKSRTTETWSNRSEQEINDTRKEDKDHSSQQQSKENGTSHDSNSFSDARAVNFVPDVSSHMSSHSSTTSRNLSTTSEDDNESKMMNLFTNDERMSLHNDKAWGQWNDSHAHYDSTKTISGTSNGDFSHNAKRRTPQSSTSSIPGLGPQAEFEVFPTFDTDNWLSGKPGASWDVNRASHIPGPDSGIQSLDMSQPGSLDAYSNSVKNSLRSLRTPSTTSSERDTSSESPEFVRHHGGYLAMRNKPRPRYVEGTFWGYINGHESLCEELLGQCNDTSVDDQFAPVDGAGLANLLKSLPNKVICDNLLYSFLIGVRPVLPFLDVSSFRSTWDEFWQWAAKSDSTVPPLKLLQDATFFCSLFAVLYSGASAAPQPLWDAQPLSTVDRNTLVEQLKGAWVSSLELCQALAHPTFNCLTALLIGHSCSDPPAEASEQTMFLSKVIHMARSLGLHRESSLAYFNQSQKDVRRNVWWHILSLDVQASKVHGSHLYCSAADHDMQPFECSRTSDRNGSRSPTNSSASDGRISPLVALTSARHETTRFQHDLIDRLHSTKQLNQRSLDQFLGRAQRLYTNLDGLTDRLPSAGVPERGLIPSSLAKASPLRNKSLYADDSTEATVLSTWTRITIAMLKAEVAITVQKCLIGQADIRSVQGKKSWKNVLHLCIGYLRNFLQLVQIPAFSPYLRLYSARDALLQPLLLILIYLRHHNTSEESQLARYVMDEVIDYFDSEYASNNSNETENAWWSKPNEALRNGARARGQPQSPWAFIKFLRQRLTQSNPSAATAASKSKLKMNGVESYLQGISARPMPGTRSSQHPSRPPSPDLSRKHAGMAGNQGSSSMDLDMDTAMFDEWSDAFTHDSFDATQLDLDSGADGDVDSMTLTDMLKRAASAGPGGLNTPLGSSASNNLLDYFEGWQVQSDSYGG